MAAEYLKEGQIVLRTLAASICGLTAAFGYTAVQKLLKHNRPNTTALKNIGNRKEDVPRKLLLLLCIVTENEESLGRLSRGFPLKILFLRLSQLCQNHCTENKQATEYFPYGQGLI